MSRFIYTDAQVARIKAARAVGISCKAIARLTGIHREVISRWSRGAHRPDILPDPEVGPALRKIIRG